MSDDNEILSDHRWQRTTLVPPFLNDFGDSLEYVKWKSEMVPEILWIGLLLQKHGPHRTAEVTRVVVEEAQNIFSDGDYILSSDYDDLSNSDFEELEKRLDEDILYDFRNGIFPLAKYYPTIPQASILEEVPKGDNEDELVGIGKIVRDLSSRRSKLAMHTQGIYVGTLFETGKLKVTQGVDFGDLNEVFKYPDTDESQRVGSAVRATVSAVWGAEQSDDSQSEWATRFWERGFEISDCVFPQELEDQEDVDEPIKEPGEDFFEELTMIGLKYEEDLKSTIIELWTQAPIDPKFTGKNEVLDGLLMRQVNLVTSLAVSPRLLTVDIAGIILRCMAETQITLEWFNQNGNEEDYKKFIEYGLGQQKLVQEHMGKLLENKDSPPKRLEHGFEKMEEKLEAQRYKHLIPVDVGHWADKNTRELAQEAGCKDLYDLRFQQHNPAVHGSWDFIHQNNLVQCQNPLHQFHQIPQFQPLPRIPFALVEGGNIMKRSLDSWMQARGLNQEIEVFDLAETVREFIKESAYFDDMPL